MSVKDPRKLQEAVDRKVLQDEGVAVPDDSFSAYDSETNPVNEETYPEMLVGANPDAGEGPRSRRERAEELASEISRQNLAAQAAGKRKAAQSYWAVSWQIFRRNRLGMACLAVVLFLVAVAVLAPVIAPYDPDAQNLRAMLQPPSAEHWFGTDNYGRDIFSRVLYG